MTVRERVRSLVDASWFQAGVITLILINAVILGFETSKSVMEAHGGLLTGIDRVILSLFVVELALRIFAYRKDFLCDAWGWFDVIIIGIALMPATGPFAVLRVLRILRVLRLLSVIPTLRHVVTGLFRALPGMVSIMVLVALLLYVSAVMATKLFGEDTPRYFGDLWTSLFTLFQIFTADGWGNIAQEVMKDQPLAWIFFVVFVLVSTLIALNLFIAVAVEALDKAGHEEREAGGGGEFGQGAEGPDGGPRDGPDEGQRRILSELRSLREEIARLRESQTEQSGDRSPV